MKRPVFIAVVVAAVTGGMGCFLVPQAARCDDDDNCPSDLVCRDGLCVAGEGEGILFEGSFAPAVAGSQSGISLSGTFGVGVDGVAANNAEISLEGSFQ